jgi:hypothetical protein
MDGKADNISLSLPFLPMESEEKVVLRYKNNLDDIHYIDPPVELSLTLENNVYELILYHLKSAERFISLGTQIATYDEGAKERNKNAKPDKDGKKKRENPYRGSEPFIKHLSFMGKFPDDDQSYFLHEGRWYEVSESLVESVKKEFEAVDKVSKVLPTYYYKPSYT